MTRRQRLQRRLLDLDEMRPDLAARRAVNPQPRNRTVPVPQERIPRVEAVEAPALERVVLHVATTALLLPVFLERARLRWQGREAPMRREGQVDVVAIGIVEAGADAAAFKLSWGTTRGTPPMSRNARSWSRRNVSSF
jgi:hypothetical protein